MTRKIAVFSDVHANRAALKAMKADAVAMGVTGYWMLGDMIGRGCDPIGTVLDLRRLYHKQSPLDQAFWLVGNHDKNVLNLWHRALGHEDAQLAGLFLEDGEVVGTSTGDSNNTVLLDQWHYNILTLKASDRTDLLAWLETLPTHHIAPANHVHAGVAVAHAALRYVDGTISEYETVMSYLNSHLIQSQFQELALYAESDVRLILGGHTHMSGVWRDTPEDVCAEELVLDNTIMLDLHAHRYYINVGSVGFPRHYDRCPTYMILTWETDEKIVYLEKRQVTYTPDMSKCGPDYPQIYRDEMMRCE